MELLQYYIRNAVTFHFQDRLENCWKINDGEKYRLEDEMETKDGDPKDGNVSEKWGNS